METTDDKKEILKQLIRSEKDTIQKFAVLVNKAKDLLWIEEDSGRTIILKKGLTLSDNIKLQLIGAYFAFEYGLRPKKTCNIDELKEYLCIGGRALSRPLGQLAKSRFISKTQGEYLIKYYFIEDILNEIINYDSSKQVRKNKIIKRKKQNMETHNDKEELLKQLNSKGIEELKKVVEVDGDALNHIFDFDDKDVRIIYHIASETTTESIKQYRATILYLTILKFCYSTNEICSKELRRKLEDIGLTKSLVNLSTNLKSYQTQIVHKKGERGNTDTSYKLTIPGEQEGVKIIKELVNRIMEEKNVERKDD